MSGVREFRATTDVVWRGALIVALAMLVAVVARPSTAAADAFASPFAARAAAMDIEPEQGPIYLITPPAIQGRPNVGQLLTLQFGEWEGNAAPSATSWYRCTWSFCQFVGQQPYYRLTAADTGYQM